KQVPLSHANLCSSAYQIRQTLELTSEDRCLNIMPLFHIHGLVAAMLASFAAGASIVCTPGFYAPEFFSWMKTFCPTWYTAVPTMHQAILARAAAVQEQIVDCPLRFIRSSSSALPPQVFKALEATFGVPVIEAYGMTEAAHQMASNPLPPRKRKIGTVGQATGKEIAIMDEHGNILPSGKIGEIVVRGPGIMHGYAHNPTANAQAFTRGWFRTGDQGYLDSDSYLFITGRLKEIINRGGEKISPREVEEVLLSHDAIGQAVAFAIPDAKLGEEVAVAVVLKAEMTLSEREIQEFAALHIAAFKVPRYVAILKEIPTGPTGKMQRSNLGKILGPLLLTSVKDRPEREFVAPRTLTEKALARIWSQVLDLDEISIYDTFLELGGDSMLATRIISKVSAALKRDIPILTFFDTPTIYDIASYIDQPAILA
ncbi:MAG TPA: non-ribosomal peptide synthetase, partial [Ktedonobacteraceae bacterium]|nr:non-ribosomal peptide synthetase [Ktedonobacteraceae bacterium]